MNVVYFSSLEGKPWLLFTTLRDQPPIGDIQIKVQPISFFQCLHRFFRSQNALPCLLRSHEARYRKPASATKKRGGNSGQDQDQLLTWNDQHLYWTCSPSGEKKTKAKLRAKWISASWQYGGLILCVPNWRVNCENFKLSWFQNSQTSTRVFKLGDSGLHVSPA